MVAATEGSHTHGGAGRGGADGRQVRPSAHSGDRCRGPGGGYFRHHSQSSGEWCGTSDGRRRPVDDSVRPAPSSRLWPSSSRRFPSFELISCHVLSAEFQTPLLRNSFVRLLKRFNCQIHQRDSNRHISKGYPSRLRKFRCMSPHVSFDPGQSYSD